MIMAIYLNKKPEIYKQEHDDFMKELHHFHETRGTKFKKSPTINGQQIDLYLLYNLVISKGGWVKITNKNDWDSILKPFNLPTGCVNSGVALKQIYVRYLDRYEKLHYLGEEADRHSDDEEDIRHKRWTARSACTVPLSYNYHQHNVSDTARSLSGMSTDLYKPSEYDRIMLSLISPLPNEQDFAINVCTLLANDTKHGLKLSRCPRIIDYLLGHAGVFNCPSLRETLQEVYRDIRKNNLSNFWDDAVVKRQFLDLTFESKFTRRKINLPVLTAKLVDPNGSKQKSTLKRSHQNNDINDKQSNNDEIISIINCSDSSIISDKNDNLVKEKCSNNICDLTQSNDDVDDNGNDDEELSDKSSGKKQKLLSDDEIVTFKNMNELIKKNIKLNLDSDNETDRELFCLGRTLGTQDYIGQRVLQIASIVRNLSFTEDNIKLMANNVTFIRFSLLCMNSAWSSLHQYGYDMLSNVAVDLLLKDPQRDRISECILVTITEGIFSQDRFIIISSLDILNKLSQNESNEDTLLRYLEQNVYEKICLFLTIQDIMLLIYTLECLYSLTSLGEKACNAIMRVHRIIDILVSLVTIEAQSYGTKACINMKVVETIPANSNNLITVNQPNPSTSNVTYTQLTTSSSQAFSNIPTPLLPQINKRPSTPNKGPSSIPKRPSTPLTNKPTINQSTKTISEIIGQQYNLKTIASTNSIVASTSATQPCQTTMAINVISSPSINIVGTHSNKIIVNHQQLQQLIQQQQQTTPTLTLPTSTATSSPAIIQTIPLNQQQIVINQQPKTILNQQPIVISQQPNVMNQQTTFINQQTNLVNQQSNIINHQPTVINQQQNIINQQTVMNQQQSNLINQQTTVINQPTIINQQTITNQQQTIINQNQIPPNVTTAIINNQPATVFNNTPSPKPLNQQQIMQRENEQFALAWLSATLEADTNKENPTKIEQKELFKMYAQASMQIGRKSIVTSMCFPQLVRQSYGNQVGPVLNKTDNQYYYQGIKIRAVPLIIKCITTTTTCAAPSAQNNKRGRGLKSPVQQYTITNIIPGGIPTSSNVTTTTNANDATQILLKPEVVKSQVSAHPHLSQALLGHTINQSSNNNNNNQQNKTISESGVGQTANSNIITSTNSSSLIKSLLATKVNDNNGNQCMQISAIGMTNLVTCENSAVTTSSVVTNVVNNNNQVTQRQNQQKQLQTTQANLQTITTVIQASPNKTGLKAARIARVNGARMGTVANDMTILNDTILQDNRATVISQKTITPACTQTPPPLAPLSGTNNSANRLKITNESDDSDSLGNSGQINFSSDITSLVSDDGDDNSLTNFENILLNGVPPNSFDIDGGVSNQEPSLNDQNIQKPRSQLMLADLLEMKVDKKEPPPHLMNGVLRIGDKGLELVENHIEKALMTAIISKDHPNQQQSQTIIMDNETKASVIVTSTDTTFLNKDKLTNSVICNTKTNANFIINTKRTINQVTDTNEPDTKRICSTFPSVIVQNNQNGIETMKDDIIIIQDDVGKNEIKTEFKNEDEDTCHVSSTAANLYAALAADVLGDEDDDDDVIITEPSQRQTQQASASTSLVVPSNQPVVQQFAIPANKILSTSNSNLIATSQSGTTLPTGQQIIVHTPAGNRQILLPSALTNNGGGQILLTAGGQLISTGTSSATGANNSQQSNIKSTVPVLVTPSGTGQQPIMQQRVILSSNQLSQLLNNSSGTSSGTVQFTGGGSGGTQTIQGQILNIQNQQQNIVQTTTSSNVSSTTNSNLQLIATNNSNSTTNLSGMQIISTGGNTSSLAQLLSQSGVQFLATKSQILNATSNNSNNNATTQVVTNSSNNNCSSTNSNQTPASGTVQVIHPGANALSQSGGTVQIISGNSGMQLVSSNNQNIQQVVVSTSPSLITSTNSQVSGNVQIINSNNFTSTTNTGTVLSTANTGVQIVGTQQNATGTVQIVSAPQGGSGAVQIVGGTSTGGAGQLFLASGAGGQTYLMSQSQLSQGQLNQTSQINQQPQTVLVTNQGGTKTIIILQPQNSNGAGTSSGQKLVIAPQQNQQQQQMMLAQVAARQILQQVSNQNSSTNSGVQTIVVNNSANAATTTTSTTINSQQLVQQMAKNFISTTNKTNSNNQLVTNKLIVNTTNNVNNNSSNSSSSNTINNLYVNKQNLVSNSNNLVTTNSNNQIINNIASDKIIKTIMTSSGQQINIVTHAPQNKLPTTTTAYVSTNTLTQVTNSITSSALQQQQQKRIIISSDLLYVCEWEGCESNLNGSYKSPNEVLMHAVKCHCPIDDEEILCKWPKCDPLKRKRFSLMTHLIDKHCNVEAMKLSAAKRKLAEQTGNYDALEPKTPSHPGYGPDAAIVAIKRNTTEYMNSKELMNEDSLNKTCVVPLSALQLLNTTFKKEHQFKPKFADENEGPVTKSIRLTASLILRNLVIYSHTSRRYLRFYESTLANVALSNVESSRTIAQILFDMNESTNR